MAGIIAIAIVIALILVGMRTFNKPPPPIAHSPGPFISQPGRVFTPVGVVVKPLPSLAPSAANDAAQSTPTPMERVTPQPPEGAIAKESPGSGQISKDSQPPKQPETPESTPTVLVPDYPSPSALTDNPYRYVGKNVDFYCRVSDIADVVNANCGGKYDPIMIVLVTDKRQLSRTLCSHVLGTVIEPRDGKPTVQTRSVTPLRVTFRCGPD